MPQIPIVQATGPAAVVRLPEGLPVPDYSALAGVGGTFEQFGQQLNTIGARLREQQNELDVAQMVGEFSGRVKEIEANLQYTEKDPLKWSQSFTEQTTQLQEEMASQASNKLVGKGFAQYVGRHLPVRAAEVHANALEWMGEQQTAQMRDVGDLMAKNKAQATTWAEAQAWDDGYRRLIRSNPHMKPEMAQKEELRWKEKSDKAYMAHLARNDPARLEEEEKKGYFDNVNTWDRDIIMQRAERQGNAAKVQAQQALDRFQKQYREQVERFVQTQFNEGTITKDILEEWKPAVTSEKGALWDKQWYDFQHGIKQGDFRAEADFVARIFTGDPRVALAELTRGYQPPTGRPQLYGYEFYTKYAPALEARIERLDERAFQRQIQGENKVHEKQKERGQLVLRNIDEQFTVTGLFSLKDFDFSVSEAKLGVRREFADKVDYMNGGQGIDAREFERVHLAKWLAQVQERIDPAIEAHKKALRQYQSKAALKADYGKISIEEYKRYTDLQRALDILYKEKANYETTLKKLGGRGGGPATPTSRTKEYE